MSNTSDIFNYNAEFFGGTEAMARYFHKNIYSSTYNLKKYQSYIFPGIFPSGPEIINDEREIILWAHVLIEQLQQGFQFFLNDPRLLSKIKYVIAVSEWHKEVIMKELNIPEEKVFVIYNALNDMPKNYDKFKNVDKVKIIHTSSPYRGLEVLLNSIKYIDEDFELNIFNEIIPEIEPEQSIYYQLEKDKRVNFYGKTPKKVIKKFLDESHIYAYPTVYKETFCISLIEGLSANCLSIFPDLGVMPEVSSGYGQMYKYNDNFQKHAYEFAEELKKGIKLVKSGTLDLGDQASFINDKYSWKKFENRWKEFNSLI
jgi:glycosyltransferase involved in cell wall biosynthesis